MSLIVEDGTGKTDSESYISVVDANTYHTSHGCPASWVGARDDAKEVALRIATQYIDSYYGALWLGIRFSAGQALDWPRAGVTTRDGYHLDSAIMPAALKQATCIAALKELESSGSLLPDVADTGSILSTDVSVGSISEKVTYAGGKTGLKKFTLLASILRGLMYPHGFVERG